MRRAIILWMLHISKLGQFPLASSYRRWEYSRSYPLNQTLIFILTLLSARISREISSSDLITFHFEASNIGKELANLGSEEQNIRLSLPITLPKLGQAWTQIFIPHGSFINGFFLHFGSEFDHASQC